MNARDAGTVKIGTWTPPRLGYGTMRLPGPGVWGPPHDRDEALAVLRRAVELGVRVIDTAWYYGDDVANELVAAALYPYPDDLILVTKLGAERPDGQWRPAVSPQALRAGNERDRRVLRLDTVPVTHLRWTDGTSVTGETAGGVTFAQALDTLLDLQARGRIGHIGLSNVALQQLDYTLSCTPVATVSNMFSVGNPADAAVLQRCESLGIAYLPFFPLQAGHPATTVTAVATELGVSPFEVSIAWLLQRSPVIVPIPGTSSLAHLEQNIAAAGLILPPETIERLGARAGATSR